MLYRHKKTAILAILAASMLFPNVAVAASRSYYYQNDKRVYTSANPVRLYINGIETKGSVSPVMYNNTLMVPVRDLLDAVHGFVEYNAEKKSTNMVYRNKIITVYADSYTAYISETPYHMDVAPKIIDNKLMVPLRFMVDNFGFSMQWDNENRIAFVDEVEEVIEEIPEVETTPETTEETPSNIEVTPEKVPEGVPDTKIESINSLAYQQNSRSLITSAILPSDGSQRFIIPASMPMTSVTANIRDGNKLVFYIDNTDLNVSDYVQKISGNPYLYEIRYNNEDDGNSSVTDVVFEFSQSSRPIVSYSEDRKNIYVDFEEYTVDNVEHSIDGDNDVFKITTSKGIEPKVSYLQNPDRLVIDFPASVMKNTMDKSINGKLASSYRGMDYDGHTGRVVLDLKEQSKYDVYTSGNTTTVKLLSPSYKNITYDGQNKRFAFKKTSSGFNVEGTYDNYNSRNIVISMSDDLSSSYGYGNYYIQDDFVDNLEISSSNGKTQFTLHENQILAFKITDDSDYYYLELYKPKDLYPMVVILDPGHGDHDPGVVRHGLQEKDLNLDIGLKVFDLLKNNDNIKAYMTRDSDFFVTLNGRSDYANPLGDVFISIHNNSSTSSTPYGTEVYYKTHYNDQELGFSSAQLAQIMQNNIVASIGSNDRGIREENYAVVRNTTIPACLCEIGFVSNAYEASLLADEGYRQKAAEGIYNGILEVFETYNPPR